LGWNVVSSNAGRGTRDDLKILIKEGRNKQANVESKKEEHTDNMAMTREEYHTN